MPQEPGFSEGSGLSSIVPVFSESLSKILQGKGADLAPINVKSYIVSERTIALEMSGGKNGDRYATLRDPLQRAKNCIKRVNAVIAEPTDPDKKTATINDYIDRQKSISNPDEYRFFDQAARFGALIYAGRITPPTSPAPEVRLKNLMYKLSMVDKRTLGDIFKGIAIAFPDTYQEKINDIEEHFSAYITGAPKDLVFIETLLTAPL